MLVRTTSALAREFERAVEAIGPEDDLVVGIAADIETRADEVVLRVEGDADPDEPALQLRRLSAAAVARRPSAALFFVEAYYEGREDEPFVAAQHAEQIVRALDVRTNGYGAMVGVCRSQTAEAGWPFTRRVLATIDDPASHDELGAVRMSRVHDLLQAAGAFDTSVQRVALVRGHSDLVIVAPRDASSDTLHRQDPEAVPYPAAPANTFSVIDRASKDPPSEPSLSSQGDRGASPAAKSHPPSSLLNGAHDAVPIAPSSPSGAVVAPELRTTQPSLPSIDPLIDVADDARERGALPEALAGYKAALMVASPDDKRTRATIYARIGDLKRAQGRLREAELNFEKALAADPKHQTAFDALVSLATENHDMRRAIDLRRRRLATLAEADDRVAELRAIAETFADHLRDSTAAIEALDQALALQGKSRSSLEGLGKAYEKLQRWQGVVHVLCELAEDVEDAKDRSAARFAAADVALARLRDEVRGLRLLEQALDDDPTNDKALRALIAVRTAGGDWRAIDEVYSRLIDRLASVGDVERAWDTCRKLGVLRRDRLHDPARGVEAFTRAVQFKPESVDSRALLAEMHIAAGDQGLAVSEFERIAEYAPTRSSTYARLFALHRRAGRIDRAWLAGCALAELGNLDMDQQLFLDQYRLDGPIRPARSLDDAAWDEFLRAPGSDDVVTDVLRAIGAPAAATRVDELRQARMLIALDPAQRQSATATVSAVRSFHWAAQVLDVAAPDLYVLEDVPGGVAAVHALSPTTALGPDVLRGLSAKDLAFLAGRHLTYYRPEHYALICYPTLHDLSALFLGAVKVVLPELDAPAAMREAAVRISKLLSRNATEGEKRRLAAAVERLQARGGRVDLGAWIRSVELSAQRAGLLLCGDLAVSTARLRAEAGTRAIADLTFDDKRGDLLAFCASEKLASARALLGADAHTSVTAALSTGQPQA